ncbi:hypothetical protein FQR65_LT20881 [Abscondita terminalis]|nr:hypothetical protein FQR65_LT20881 [Abscondita terminalis]
MFGARSPGLSEAHPTVGFMAPESFAPGPDWGDAIAAAEARAAPDLLSGLHSDPESFEFTRRLLEIIAGTEDALSSAVEFREVAQEVPRSLSARDRFAVRAGGAASLGLPWAVMPVARRWLRERVSRLVLATKLPTNGAAAGRMSGLGDALRRSTEAGLLPVLQPIGDAVHGPVGAGA